LYIVYNMDMNPNPGQRPNLSDDVAFDIRMQILDGRLAAGERLREEKIAEQFGVSRTPVREALAMLAVEGAVRSIPRRGYIVRELSLREARDIYPIRAILDPEALRLSGVPTKKQLDRLEEIVDELLRAETVSEAIRFDEDWHRKLWTECPNKVLIELIEQFIGRTRRYELASMGHVETIRRTTAMKAQIVRFLRDGDLEAACNMLRKSLTSGGHDVYAWLESKEEPT
jgi:DNA-binding GntR family transcriptional regulator